MSMLPRATRGRKTEEQMQQYQLELKAFAQMILDIRQGMSFAPSIRGWCYILEEHGLLKGEFDRAQTIINDCRKSGLLPLEISAEDANRKTDGIQQLDDASPEAFAHTIYGYLDYFIKSYTPIGFWDTQQYYVEMMVEKIDLKSLFDPVCREFYVPLTNARGWTDLHSRAAMMRRFQQHEEEGRQCVLLYCGDHDPGGLQIGKSILDNMRELAHAINWSPDDLIIDRFGLNAEFIDANGLSWAHNLETSSGGRLDDPKHKDHEKPYVQDYIRAHGIRKCEANALVVRESAGRQLCRDAILRYIDDEAPLDYAQSLAAPRLIANQMLTRIVGR